MNAPVRRPWAALGAGLAFMIGISQLGDTPDTRASSATIARYFVEHRTSVFTGVIISSFAMIALLAGTGDFSGRLAVAGRNSASRMLQSVATVAVSLVFVTMLVPYALLGYTIGADSPELAKGVFELTLVAVPLIACPFGALLLTIGAVGRKRVITRWFSVFSIGAGAILIGSACSFAARGPFSPDVQQQVVLNVISIWLIVSTFGVSASHRNTRWFRGGSDSSQV